jgi:hypothetical protein
MTASFRSLTNGAFASWRQAHHLIVETVLALAAANYHPKG